MRNLVIVLLLFCSASCLYSVPRLDDRRALIVGTWQGDNRSEMVRVLDEKTYNPDGSASGWVKVYRVVSVDRQVLLGEMTFRSRWRLEGEFLISFDVQTDPSGLISMDEVMRDKLVVLTADEMKLRMEDGTTGVFRKKTG